MTDNVVLEAYENFIKTIVKDLQLEKPHEANEAPELVPPIVVVGYLPPKNFLPEGYDIPAVIVGYNDGSDDGNEAGLNMRITCTTYSAGRVDCIDVEEEASYSTIFDMKGYVDLVRLITLIRTKIARTGIIEGKTSIKYPIKWGMYEEQPWPYWYGWIEFETSLTAVEGVTERNIDNLDLNWNASEIKVTLREEEI